MLRKIEYVKKMNGKKGIETLCVCVRGVCKRGKGGGDSVLGRKM